MYKDRFRRYQKAKHVAMIGKINRQHQSVWYSHFRVGDSPPEPLLIKHMNLHLVSADDIALSPPLTRSRLPPWTYI
jgi:hypothetical protein